MGSLKYQAIAKVSLDEATFLRLLVRMLRRFSGKDRKNLLEALESGVFDLSRTVTSELVSHGLKGKAAGSDLSTTDKDRVISLVRGYWSHCKNDVWPSRESEPKFIYTED